MRRTAIRQGGFPHTMLVLSDLTRTLREEERRAWQRLVRVLGGWSARLSGVRRIPTVLQGWQ